MVVARFQTSYGQAKQELEDTCRHFAPIIAALESQRDLLLSKMDENTTDTTDALAVCMIMISFYKDLEILFGDNGFTIFYNNKLKHRLKEDLSSHYSVSDNMHQDIQFVLQLSIKMVTLFLDEWKPLQAKMVFWNKAELNIAKAAWIGVSLLAIAAFILVAIGINLHLPALSGIVLITIFGMITFGTGLGYGAAWFNRQDTEHLVKLGHIFSDQFQREEFKQRVLGNNSSTNCDQGVANKIKGTPHYFGALDRFFKSNSSFQLDLVNVQPATDGASGFLRMKVNAQKSD